MDRDPFGGPERTERTTRRVHWERRVVLLLVPLALAGALAVGALLDLGGGDGTGDEATSLPPPPEPQSFVRGGEEHPIRIGRPVGWRQRKIERGVRLRSRDRSTQLIVIAAADAGKRGAVIREALRAAREGYQGFERLAGGGGGPRTLAGRPAVSRAFEGRAASGERVRGLIAAVSVGDATYLVEVFSARSAPAQRLVEAQVALGSLELGRRGGKR